MLKSVVDEIPQGLDEHYAKREDGKFQLSVEPVDGISLENVGGLKSALSKERASREAFERKLKSFGDLDPDAARSAIDELDELRKIDPSKEADRLAQEKTAAAIKKLTDKHSTEIKTRDDALSRMHSIVDNVMRRQQATAAIAAARGSVDLLLPHVLSKTRMLEKDGEFTVVVIGDDDNPAVDSSGKNVTIAQLVDEMRQNEIYGRAFDASGSSGSGKGPASTGGAGQKRSAMSAAEKSAYIEKYGQDRYLQLPK